MNRKRAGGSSVLLQVRRRDSPASADSVVGSSESSGDSESESTSDTARVRVVEHENAPNRGNTRSHNSAAKPLLARARMTASKAKTAARVRTVSALTPHEMKRTVEKKFRTRYRALQEAYESRLHALAVQLQHAVAQVQGDTTAFCLQENPLTREFAGLRLGEIVHECFFGERERYIQVVSDQVAWQASDLREQRRKLRAMTQRERTALDVCAQRERDVEALERQLAVRDSELQGQKRLAVQHDAAQQSLKRELTEMQRALETAQHDQRAIETLQRECEALEADKRRANEAQQLANEQHARLEHEVETLKAANVKLEMDKHAGEQEVAHVHHLLSLSEAKSRELSDALQREKSRDWPSHVARLETELAHCERARATLERDHAALQTKYADFGAHVDAFMAEQASAKAAAQQRDDERAQQMQQQLETARQQAAKEREVHERELKRLAEQLQQHRDAVASAEQAVVALEQQLRAADARASDDKLRAAGRVSKLEQERTHWQLAAERETARAAATESAMKALTDQHERDLARARKSFDRQLLERNSAQDAQARARWEHDVATQHDARIEALKAKYDAALERQQSELLRAKQQALDAAAAISAKYEATQRAQRADNERDTQRRAEAAARERAAQDDARARELAHQRLATECDEREKRIAERERLLLEKERAEERRRSELTQRLAAAQAAQAQAVQTQAAQTRAVTSARSASVTAAPAPAVVVLNVQTPDDNSESAPTAAGRRVTTRSTARRADPTPLPSDNSSDAVVSTAQHAAELQAREAQVRLEAETRLQTALRELQSRKDAEFRAAMVNVRRGIQKLESAVEHARAQTTRLEREVASEREAFVALKQERDDAGDSKRTLVQRLADANEHLGKLRSVVDASERKRKRLDEQLARALDAERVSAAAASAAQHTVDELRDAMRASETQQQQQDAELTAARNTCAQLEARARTLDDALKASRADLAAATQTAATTTERKSTTLERRVQAAEAREAAAVEQLEKAKDAAAQLRNHVAALEQSRATQDAALQQLAVERGQQRQELSSLARAHRNASERLETQLRDEATARECAEQQLHTAQKALNDSALHRQRVLLVYRMHLAQLKKDVVELRRGVKRELRATLQHCERDVATCGAAVSERLAAAVRARDAAAEQQLARARTDWTAQLQRQELERSGHVDNAAASEQSRLDDMQRELLAATHALDAVTAQVAAEKSASAALQLALNNVKADASRLRTEQTALREQLALSHVNAQRESSDRDAARTQVEHYTRVARVLQRFVDSLLAAQEGGSSSSSCRAALRELETCDAQQLAVELDRVAAQLFDERQRAIVAARDEGAEAARRELETAKRALQPLWAAAAPSTTATSAAAAAARGDGGDSSGDLFEHLPWYVTAVRAAKQLQDDAARSSATLQLELAAKESQLQALRQRKTQLQDAARVLRVENDAVARELSAATHATQQKREHELQALRLECDRRLEQAKHAHGTERLKTEQEHQIAVTQLQDALEAERRSHSALKNQSAALQLEATKTHDELRDKIRLLEKTVDEVRDAAVKWKRRAKLAVQSTTSSVGANTPTRAHFFQSASSHGTANDSDTPFRFVAFPSPSPSHHRSSMAFAPPPRTPRRPSSAIADLSSLMEESLQSLQKDGAATAASPQRAFGFDR